MQWNMHQFLFVNKRFHQIVCLRKSLFQIFQHSLFRTNSQIMDTILCRSITKSLTPYRFKFVGWGLDGLKVKGEIHSFPTMYMTNSQIMDTILCRSVTKNLTAYRFISAGWELDDMKAEIHSFPTMYIIGGGKWGRNGSKLRFSEKKWSKNSFFVLHKFGSTDFEGVSDPYFWRYR